MKQNVNKLKHKIGITFRWDFKGECLIKRRAKANKMNQSEYLRYAVEQEASNG